MLYVDDVTAAVTIILHTPVLHSVFYTVQVAHVTCISLGLCGSLAHYPVQEENIGLEGAAMLCGGCCFGGFVICR